MATPTAPSPAGLSRGRLAAYAAMVVALMVVGLVIAYAVGSTLGPRFSSVSSVLVRPPLTAQMVVTGNPGAAEDIQRVVDTDVQVAQSRQFLSIVATSVNLPGVTTDALTKDLLVTAPADTDVLVFTAAEADVPTAQAVSDAAAMQFVLYDNELSGQATSVQSTDPTVAAAIARLQVLQQLVPPATVVERATPATRTLPNHSRDIVLGLTAGFVVALIVIALRESVRRSPTR